MAEDKTPTPGSISCRPGDYIGTKPKFSAMISVSVFVKSKMGCKSGKLDITIVQSYTFNKQGGWLNVQLCR